MNTPTIKGLDASSIAVLIELLKVQLKQLKMPDDIRPYRQCVNGDKTGKQYTDGQGEAYDTTPENDLAWRSISSMILILEAELLERPTTFLDSFEEFDDYVHSKLALQRKVEGPQYLSRMQNGKLFVPFMPKVLGTAIDEFWCELDKMVTIKKVKPEQKVTAPTDAKGGTHWQGA